MSFSLIKFQLGPVQEFIAQARSTRDLWSGSYLLSFLVAAGVRALPDMRASLIFPNPDNQPLLDAPASWQNLQDQRALLTPNLPNLFVAKVPSAEAEGIAYSIKLAIEREWKAIAKSVWGAKGDLKLSDEKEFWVQADRHLSMAWQITPCTGAYPEDYANNGWHLDAVRQTRNFDAISSGMVTILPNGKDALNGRDAAVMGGEDAKKIGGRYEGLFKHADHLGAVALIKRVWHLTYLKDELNLRTESKAFKIRSTRAIAAHVEKDDDKEDSETASGEKYLAAIAFDGDQIGKWVSGELLEDKSDLASHHAKFSQCLSKFALGRARKIVEREEKTHGFLIYAGGDDVVALVPADEALETARQLREAFREETSSINGVKNSQPDASAGIAIAHFKSPLQDLVREAQIAEKRAKNTVGRPAFSVSLMKRSGEISHWGAKWDDGGLALYQAIATALHNEELSAKFPHRVCQLLTPYLTQKNQMDVADFNALEVITREFEFALARQATSAMTKQNRENLLTSLKSYLELIEGPQKQLTAMIELCTTVAFADRSRDKSKTSSR